MSDPERTDVGTTLVTTTGPSGSVKHLEQGTKVGRYVVIDRIGEGGMGVVYRAFDPELDRPVALKLLHSTLGDPTWLHREAQALARLAHPNVVVVYDVGQVFDDKVFVAMELVDGITLREWVRTEHSWREVQRVMLAAGAGLAAAHAAKLVHRDFKPENVIIGKDGRVRVMDFGLARVRPDSRPPHVADHAIPTLSPLTSMPTAIDGVVGTPAYMAPEIFDGDPADARSDQFAFGVTLYEALCRKRPYAQVGLVPDKNTPPPVFPADAKVPARLAQVALRAIAVDPAKRHPSMDALLAALAVDPATRRRRALIAVGVLAAIGGAVAVTVAVSPAAEPPPCKGVERRLAGIWDAAAKQRIKDAFVATKAPLAPAAFAALERALDGYTAKWVATSVESCEATRVRRDQTEQALSLRQACLDRRLDELRAVTALLVEPNKSILTKADQVAAELEPITRCSNVDALREAGVPPPELRAKIDELEKQIAEAKARIIAGQYLPALTAAAAATKHAKELDFASAEAEAEVARGAALSATGSHEDAVATLTNAVWTAEAARRDDVVAHAAIAISGLISEALGKPKEAKFWLALARAAAQRVGAEHDLEPELFKFEGIIAADLGDIPGAIAAQERSFGAAKQLYGDNSILAGNEALFASTLTRGFEYARAIPHFQHALALREPIVGSDDMDVALMVSNLAVCYQFTDDPRARETFERAKNIRERMFGLDSPILVPTLDNYAVFLGQQNDLRGALDMIERAHRLAEVYPGKEQYSYHVVATDHADVLVAAGKLAEARALYDETLALEVKTQSTALPTTQTSRAELAIAEKQWADAEAYAQKAVAGFEAAGGADNPELWRPLGALGRAKIGRGQPAEARPLLERALAIAERVHLRKAAVAPIRDALAHL